MGSLFQHFRQEYSNKGVNLSPEEHAKGVLAQIRASWVEQILRWGDTKSIVFDGVFYQGHGGTTLRQGALENVVQKVTQDHTWKEKWPSNRRHRDIRYFLDYDVRVNAIPTGDEEPEEKGDGPLSAPALPESFFETNQD
jgi:hypothetical protein